MCWHARLALRPSSMFVALVSSCRADHSWMGALQQSTRAALEIALAQHRRMAPLSPEALELETRLHWLVSYPWSASTTDWYGVQPRLRTLPLGAAVLTVSPAHSLDIDDVARQLKDNVVGMDEPNGVKVGAPIRCSAYYLA